MAAKTKTKPKDGIYEMILLPEAEIDGVMRKCPVTSVSVPCIVGEDPRTGQERRYNVQATVGVSVPQLECPKCEHRWEPEQPLRPGGALRLDSESKWRKRYQDSFNCPKCEPDTNGRRPKGHQQRAIAPGQQPPHRKMYTRWYLTADELKEMKRLLDPNIERKRSYDTMKGQKDEDIKIPTGWESYPIVHRWLDENGVKQEIPLAPFVQVRLAVDDNALSQEALEEMGKISSEIGHAMKMLGEITEEMASIQDDDPDKKERLELLEAQKEELQGVLKGLQSRIDARS